MIAQYGTFEYPLAERYRFEEELGRGAMGTVYRAKDVRLGRPVAIKMLHPTLTNELGVARFQSEIRIAAGLHHPNIVGVHEAGEADGRLFYVMDYLGGETLRARLHREKQLAVDDALSIIEQVAAGLQYAHDHGVVHRDVKPENIILAEGRASILDFGLARALSDVDTQRLTASGLAVGTPHYLSPEQAAAEREVGPKADQYALACVLYEMLAGEPPFTGPTASAIAMRHIAEEPKRLRLRRHTTPLGVEAAVLRALEKVPGDRFASVSIFTAALHAPVAEETARSPRPIGRRAFAASAGIVLLLAAAILGVALVRPNAYGLSSLGHAIRSITGADLDSDRFVVLPVVSGRATGAPLEAAQRLSVALARWSDVSVPTAAELRDATAGYGTSPLTATIGSSIARALGARRFVLIDVTSENGYSTVHADLRDVRGGFRPKGASIAISSSASGTDSLYAHLALTLLFGDDAVPFEDASLGTRSRLALQEYIRGRLAMHRWNLPHADSALAAALRVDPAFPQAYIALAQVRNWAKEDPPETPQLIARALDGTASLSERDRTHAMALRDLRAHRYPAACAEYRALIARDPLDFAAWYGSAECNRRDNTVVAQAKGISRRHFRGNLQYAIGAIDRAFDLIPQVDECCTARVNEVLRPYFSYTQTSKVRLGSAELPDTTAYVAYPELVSDTLAFVPHRASEMRQQPPPQTHDQAVRAQRSLFFATAAKRVALAPQSADALALFAEALELNGDVAAVDTTRKARSLTHDPGRALHLAVREAWLRIKFALPGNLRELSSIRVFADSLLRNARVITSADAALLGGLAAILGDANGAASFAERSAGLSDATEDIPPQVVATANALLAYAAVGGPVDSIRDLEARLVSAIDNAVAHQRRPLARDTYLARALGLAYPHYRSTVFDSLNTLTDRLIAAEAAYAMKDYAKVRRIIGDIDGTRIHMQPADVTLDALYPETWLLASIGDTASALRRVSATLDALRWIPAIQFEGVANAGALRQAMQLRVALTRSSLAHPGSANWDRAIEALSDPAKVALVQPVNKVRAPER